MKPFRELNKKTRLLFLIGLTGELKLNGFKVVIEQLILAQQLLDELSDDNNAPDDLDTLSISLSSIFCCSPEEQEMFRLLFQQQLTETRISLSEKDEDNQIEPNRNNRKATDVSIKNFIRLLNAFAKFRPFYYALGAAAISIGIPAIIFYLSTPTATAITRTTIVGKIMSEGQPVRNASVALENTNYFPLLNGNAKNPTAVTDDNGAFALSVTLDDQPRNLIVSAVGYSSQIIKIDLSRIEAPYTADIELIRPQNTVQPILLFVAIVAIIFWSFLALVIFVTTRWLYRKLICDLWLIKNSKEKEVKSQLYDLVVHTENTIASYMPESLHLLNRLTISDKHEFSRIDLKKTIEADIRYDRPKVVYKRIKRKPAYLVLIDQKTNDDQQAMLVEEFCSLMLKAGVEVDSFWSYNGHSLFRKSDFDPKFYSIRDLADLYSQCSLIWVGAGGEALSLLKKYGTLLGAVDSNIWSERTLFTEGSLSKAEYSEFENFNFRIVSFKDLRPDYTAASDDDLMKQVSSYPNVLRGLYERWTFPHPPKDELIELLCSELRMYLGEAGYKTFCVSAVYPNLYWWLTFHLAHSLALAKDSNINVFKLLTLPWFRYGSMPDWLRLRLISDMDRTLAANVQKTIGELLLTALSSPNESQNSFALDIALPVSETSDGLIPVKGLKEREPSYENKLATLSERLKNLPANSTLKDEILIGFQQKNTDNLGVQLPHQLVGEGKIASDPISGPQLLVESIVSGMVLLLVPISFFIQQPYIAFIGGVGFLTLWLTLVFFNKDLSPLLAEKISTFRFNKRVPEMRFKDEEVEETSAEEKPKSKFTNVGLHKILFRKYSKFAISILLAVFILWFFGRNLDWREVSASLNEANKPLLLLATLMICFGYLLRALRWKTLLSPITKTSLRELFATTTVGFAAVFFIGRAGEIVRPMWLPMRDKRVRPSAALVTLGVERICDLAALVGIFSLNLIWIMAPPGRESEFTYVRLAGVFMLAGVLAGIGFLFIFHRFAEPIIARIERLLERFGFLPRRLRHIVLSVLRQLARSLDIFQSIKEFALVILWTLALWSTIAMATWLVINAFGLESSFAQSLFVMGWAAIGSVVPTPGGAAGAFHAATAGGLIFLGVNQDQAAGVSIAMHLVYFAPALLFGAFYFLRGDLSISGMREALSAEHAVDEIEHEQKQKRAQN